MYFVLSPAKNLNEAADAPLTRHSQPRLLSQAEALMPVLRQLAPQDMAKLMGVSDKIALLNTERNDNWQPPFTLDNAKQAVYLFNGDVYAGLDAHTLPETAVDYMQTHVALLSGLYGLLRPLDLIQPYRLEMGTRLANPRGKDLYAFWGERITELLAKMMAEQGSKVLINLASQEYFKSVHTAKLPARVITPVFKDEKNGQYKVISFLAKRARGLMARYVIEHRLAQVDALKTFDSDGYRFVPEVSKADQWVFRRDKVSA